MKYNYKYLILAERTHDQTLKLHAAILYFSLSDVPNVLEYGQDCERVTNVNK